MHPEDRKRPATLWAAAVTKRAVLGIEHRVKRADGAWGTFAVRAVPVQDEDGSTREWVGVHTDITENKRAEERLRFLAEVSTLFSSQLDSTPRWARVAGLSVPAFADWCVIDVLGPGQPPTRVAVAFADPVGGAAQAEALRRRPPAPDEPGGIAEVLRTGQARACAASVPAAHWQGVITSEAALGAGGPGHPLVPHGATASPRAGHRRVDLGMCRVGAPLRPRRPGFWPGSGLADRHRHRLVLLAETDDALDRELQAGRATEEARRLLDAIFEAAPGGTGTARLASWFHPHQRRAGRDQRALREPVTSVSRSTACSPAWSRRWPTC